MIVLETERLLLRELSEDDFEPYAAMSSDPQVSRYMGGAPMTRGDAWRSLAMFVGHQVLRGYSNWAVIERESGSFVGRGGLYYPADWPGLEVGWCLAREHWGNGYATELGKACVAYAFDKLGADEVVSVIHPYNARSIAVAERIGHRYRYDIDVKGQRCVVYGQRRPQGPQLNAE